MRVLGEIPNADCKITLFAWNGKYLIKIERGPFEQTFKISELEVGGVDDIKALCSGRFIEQALARFHDMDASLSMALDEG